MSLLPDIELPSEPAVELIGLGVADALGVLELLATGSGTGVLVGVGSGGVVESAKEFHVTKSASTSHVTLKNSQPLFLTEKAY